MSGEKRAMMAGTTAILPLFILGHFSHHVATGALTPLMPMIRDDLQLDYTMAGILMGAFTLTYSFMQIPTAALGNRYSRRKLLGWGLVGTGASAMLVGLGQDYLALMAALVLMGLFGSTYHALASAFLSLTFGQANRGRSLGLHTIGGSSSLLITPVLAVGAASYFGTWRAAFMVLGILPIVVGMLLMIGARSQEIEHGKLVEESRGNRMSIIAIIRLIGLLIMISAVGGMLQMAVMSFLPLYLVDKHAVSRELAGMVAGIAAGGGIIGAPLGGALSDRISRKPIIITSLLIGGPTLYLITTMQFGFVMLAVIAFYGMALSMRLPVMESVIADVIPAAQRGTALGIYFFFTQETIAVLTPVIGGLIDNYGADPTFTGMAIVGMATGALALLIGGESKAEARPAAS